MGRASSGAAPARSPSYLDVELDESEDEEDEPVVDFGLWVDEW
jgi:hypothetical protein